jgi:hypothetical protein
MFVDLAQLPIEGKIVQDLSLRKEIHPIDTEIIINLGEKRLNIEMKEMYAMIP